MMIYIVKRDKWVFKSIYLDFRINLKSKIEFDGSYGLGIRIAPVKWISVISEIRWIPGETNLELEFLYSKGDYNYYKIIDRYTKNFTTFFSAGGEL